MFEPYVIPMGIKNRYFMVETQEAKDWYDPMKWYTRLEYEWVVDNVKLDGAKVLECGGHHGHYSLVLSENNYMVIAEPHPDNVNIINLNLAENNLTDADVFHGAVAKENGKRWFSGQTNGRLVPGGGFEVNCKTLDGLMPEAEIIKLDIEGGEYEILPEGIEKMPNAHTWIIELHPQFGNPNLICREFLKLGFEASKVCRTHRRVEVYDSSEYWDSHATVIFRRPK